VTATLVLPVSHDSVSVPDRGVPEGFASTRYWTPVGEPWDPDAPRTMVIQSAFEVHRKEQ